MVIAFWNINNNTDLGDLLIDFVKENSVDILLLAEAERNPKLRAIFNNSALITISQATKAGQMRGSYEIVHDSDIAVEVKDGIATTTKNRFKEKGMTYNVFQQANGTEPSGGDEATGKGSHGQGTGTKEDRLADLTKRLNEALAAENFELASTLRDEISRVNNQK